LLALRPNSKLENHPLLAIHDCLFIIFAALDRESVLCCPVQIKLDGREYRTIFNFCERSSLQLPCQ
jgi:hypothetical protein